MYSNLRLLDSINRPEALIKTSKELGLSGLAITDHEALCAHMTVNKLAKAMRETDPDFTIALGNEIYLTETREPKQKYYHFILIAKDNDGYTQLKKLSSLAWTNIYEYGRLERVPTLKEDLKRIIKENPGHVIATSACFRQGTKVLTKNGYKNIEDICSNDYILNMYGQWEKVNFPTSRKYKGLGYKITFLENNIPTVCTANHQFLVTTNNKLTNYKKDNDFNPLMWVEAKDLITKRGSSKHICLYPTQPISYSCNNVIHRKDWEYGLLDRTHIRKNKINDKIIISPEMMRLFGLFLGDGSISINKEKNYYQISFSFNSEEFDYYWDSFVKKASDEIGIKWSINKRPINHKIDISSHCIDLVELFYYIFMDVKADTKKVPNILKHITKELDYELIFGYELADGHFRTNINKNKNIESGEMISVSISQELTLDIQELLKSLNIRSSISEKESYGIHKKSFYLSSSNSAWKRINKKTLYSHQDVINIFEKAIQHCAKNYILINGVYYKKVYIKSKEEIQMDEQVYCLNINSHSFVCNNVVVHNCIGGELSSNALLMAKARTVGDNQNAKIYYDNINNFLNYCLDIFGSDFYIECAPSTDEEQILVNQTLYKISKALGIPMVIGTDAHYLRPEDRPIHRAYLTSKDGDRETDKFYQYTYVMSPDEVKELMLKSIEDEAVIDWMFENSQELQKKIQWFSLERKQIIPKIQVKEYDKSEYHHYFGVNNDYADELKGRWKIIQDLGTSDNPQERYWINQCLEGLIEKGLWEWNYIDRICVEADIIQDIGKKLDDCLFAYFNTFQHYINLFWECGSIVGPGRGSATGFLSNYLLGITQLDPIRWDLPYWRFLNKERAELPGLMLILGSCKKRMLTICLMGVHFVWANGISEISLFRTNQLTKRAYVL